MSLRKIGLLSGTFDPVHVGHTEICLVAKAILELDKMLVLVEKTPRHKSQVSSFKDRQAMVKLAISKYENIDVFNNNQSSTTTKGTLELLRSYAPNAEYWLIIGSDVLPWVTRWRDANILLNEFKLCVFLRDNKDAPSVENTIKEIVKSFPNAEIKVMPAVWSPISSSTAKQDIKKATEKVDSIAPEVADYIQEHRLYES